MNLSCKPWTHKTNEHAVMQGANCIQRRDTAIRHNPVRTFVYVYIHKCRDRLIRVSSFLGLNMLTRLSTCPSSPPSQAREWVMMWRGRTNVEIKVTNWEACFACPLLHPTRWCFWRPAHLFGECQWDIRWDKLCMYKVLITAQYKGYSSGPS